MKVYKFFVVFSILGFFDMNGQNKALISETDSISIYETHISLNSKGNVFPTVYNKGLLYASNYESKYFNLFYSDLNSERVKIKIGHKYSLGPVTAFKNEVYFTGITIAKNMYSPSNFTIYKGQIKGDKVKKIRRLQVCDPNFSYAYPAISAEGNKMVVVSNEKGMYHLLQLKRNEKGKWEKDSVIFISQLNFEIINPSYFDENTIYFASNANKGKLKSLKYKVENDTIKVLDKEYKTGSFNIYKIEKNKNGWGLPQKMSILNSEFDDIGVLFLTEKTGYLTSFRYDNSDNIYYFKINN
jgi:hypothetical protein